MGENNAMIIQSGGTGFGKRKATIAERMIKVIFKFKCIMVIYLYFRQFSKCLD